MAKTTEMDMLHGSLADKILLFALPLAATGILQQLFNAADVAVVGRFVGTEAMAAVGSNAPLVGLVVNFFVGISLGANVVISQAMGAGDHEEVTRGVHTSILIAVFGGLMFGVLGELAIRPLLDLLAVPTDVYEMAGLYLRIYLLGLPVVFLYDFEASIFRAEGDTRTPFVVLTASGVLNVALNLFFVLAMGLDVAGVALATVGSNAFSAVVLFVLLRRSSKAIHVELTKLRMDVPALVAILRVGVPAGMQGLAFSLANICIQYAINSLGSTVMAASSAAFNIEVVAYYVINAFGQACTTFTGQNFGARQPKRCRKVLWQCVGLSLGLTAAACAVILVFGHQILQLFTTDAEVVDVGYTRLVYIFSAYLFSLLVEVMSGHLRGFGLSALPAAIALVGVCGVRIAWVYLAFPRYPSFITILMAYPISMCVTALVLWAIYFVRRKDWYDME